MKSLITAVGMAVALAAPLAALAQSNPPLTRAQVHAEMVRIERAGYNPARMNPHTAVDDIQAAQARAAQTDAAYGPAATGSSQSGAPGR